MELELELVGLGRRYRWRQGCGTNQRGRNNRQVPISYFLLGASQSNLDGLQEVWVICKEEDRKSHGLVIDSQASWNLRKMEESTWRQKMVSCLA